MGHDVGQWHVGERFLAEPTCHAHHRERANGSIVSAEDYRTSRPSANQGQDGYGQVRQRSYSLPAEQPRGGGGGRSEAQTAVTRRINVVTSRLKTTLLAKHIPGADNCEADHLSRTRDPSKWSLNRAIFRTIDREPGPHDVDRYHTSQPHCSGKGLCSLPTV